MRRELGLLVLVGGLVAGCRPDPVHPAGAAAVPTLAGPVVAKVGSRTLAAAEATEFAATREGATAALLAERERKVIAALDLQIDPELPRKRAMVRALLADEIEAKVGIEQADPAVVAEERQRAAEELREFGGFEAVSVRVASVELIENRAKLSPERVSELEELVRSTAQRLRDSLPALDAVAAAEALDTSWVDPTLRVELIKALKVVDPREVRTPPTGWVQAPRLASALEALQDGERTQVIESGPVPVFAVRRARIEPQPVDEAELTALAEGRAITKVRRERLDALLADLRLRTPVSVYPELLDEAQ